MYNVMSLLECICCSRHRHNVAICWDPYSRVSISYCTYSNLAETSLAISHFLRNLFPTLLGSQRAHVVGLYGESSPEIIGALIAVMATPAAYTPLSTHQPIQQRVEFLRMNRVEIILVQESFVMAFLDECTPTLLSQCTLTLDSGSLPYGLVAVRLHWTSDSESAENTISTTEGTCHNRDEDFLESYREQVNLSCAICEQVGSVHSPWLFPGIHPTSIAYILTTSGTTGEPVSVRVPHCCIVPNIIDLRLRFACERYDVIFNSAPLTFDPSVVEIFMCLSVGATLLTVPEAVKQNPEHLAQVLLTRHPVSVLQATPSLISRFTRDSLRHGLLGPDSKLRVLAFGGESCPDYSQLAAWRSDSNTTSIYNLYGVTEVSSWATCSPVCVSDVREAGQVPLGEPLLGTRIEVRSEEGHPVQCGEGLIWAGGNYRVCLLDGEEVIQPGCMRCTGDLGTIDKSGRLFYRGRCDRQVKRLGHRVNLDFIQQSIETLETVRSCVVTAVASPLLYQHQESQGSMSYESADSVHIVAFVVPNDTINSRSSEESSFSEINAIRADIFTQLRNTIPQASVPDEIVLVTQLPLTKHGKADIKSLVNGAYPNIYLEADLCMHTTRECMSVNFITDLLRQAAQQTTALSKWDLNVRLTELGASSFDIVRLATCFGNMIASHLGRSRWLLQTGHDLVESLLTKTLEEVVESFVSKLKKFETEDSAQEGTAEIVSPTSARAQKRSICDEESKESKYARLDFLEDSGDLPGSTTALPETLSWRRGKAYKNGRQLLTCSMDTESSVCSDKLSIKLSIRWRVDTGKCVDASPLIAKWGPDFNQNVTVFIGSHSGVFVAVDFNTGTVKWQVQLPDRIESSACLSRCGVFVLVGT